jgi:PAS domain S-box-containing protein
MAGLSQPGTLSAFLRQGDFIETIFREMPEAVVFADPDRRIRRMNAAAETLFGYSAAELEGTKTVVLYADEADYETQGRQRYNVGSALTSDRYRVRYRRKSGDTFDSTTIGTVVRDAEGEVFGYLAIIRDVSPRTRIENALGALYAIATDQHRDTDTKIQSMLELGTRFFDLPLGIVSRIENDTYTVEYAATPNGEVLPGSTFSVARTYCLHTLAADGPTAFHDVGNGPIAAHPCYKDFGLESYIGVPLIVDGGRYGTLNFSGSECRKPPFDDTDLELIRLFAQWIGNKLSLAQYISELNRARQESERLRERAEEEKAFSDHVIAESPHMVISLAPDNTVEFVNPVAEEVTGYMAGELIGRDWWKLMFPKDDGQVVSLFETLSIRRQVVDYPMTLTRKDGSERLISWTTLNRFDSDGHMTQLIGYGRDVTGEEEAIRRRQQEEQMRSLGEMAGGMAHEINNALQPLVGLVGMIAERARPLDEKLASRVDMLEQHTLYARKIVADILAFARREGSDMGILDATKLLSDVTGFLQRITPSSVIMEFDGFPPDTPALPPGTSIRASRNGMIQVLQNLVSNAVDAMDRRGHIRIALHPAQQAAPDAPPGAVRITVGDDGPGMDATTKAKLFKPFFSTKPVGRGTGLGLSVVHGLIRHWDGAIDVDSAPGEGTRISITLPTVTAEAPDTTDGA